MTKLRPDDRRRIASYAYFDQPDAVVIGSKAMANVAVATALRRSGITIDVPLSGKSQNLMKQAAARGAQYVVLVDGGRAIVRCMASRLQQETETADAANVVLACIQYDNACSYQKCASIYDAAA